ncbi:MAG: chemotaxis protein CheB [Gammaproteobacteria bacterium]|nr:MAG: chemotaxis protein CheB [Gammaproteobacteria bacterium]
MTDRILSIGIVTADKAKSHPLMELLTAERVDIVDVISPDDINAAQCARTDLHIWLVDLDEDDWHAHLDSLLHDAKVPVFINERAALSRQKHPDYWVKKLIVRLGELVLEDALLPASPVRPAVSDNRLSGELRPAESATFTGPDFPLWVIGASLGGPMALKRFFQALPQDANCSLLVAQHIDSGFVPVLRSLLEDYSNFHVRIAETGPVKPGEIIILPVTQRVHVDWNGWLRVDEKGWRGPFTPTIDEIMENIAAVWPKTGAIIFSGMPGDGVAGAQAMRERNHPVWCQTADTCASAAMPEAVAALGLHTLRGTPEFLASALASHVRRTHTSAPKLNQASRN